MLLLSKIKLKPPGIYLYRGSQIKKSGNLLEGYFCQNLYHLPLLIVSPDESRGYLGFSMVTPPPQRFPFGRDNLKNILVSPFKFGMWVYMGNATNAIVL